MAKSKDRTAARTVWLVGVRNNDGSISGVADFVVRGNNARKAEVAATKAAKRDGFNRPTVERMNRVGKLRN